jgi:hypothetical protein
MRALLFITAFALFPGSSIGSSASPILPPVSLRFYAPATVDLDAIAAIAREIQTAFNGIAELRWSTCGTRGQATWTPACEQPLHSTEIGVRVLADTSSWEPGVLGTAVPTRTDTGVMTTLYLDRIRAAAAAAGLAWETLAGVVTTHEITHLLLGPGHHSPAGLMRERWTLPLLSRREEWQLDDEERRGLVDALRRREASEARRSHERTARADVAQ